MSVLIGCIAAPVAAHAETRLASGDDPADATPTISGVPNNPDVKNVSASYDTAGSVSLTVSFYNSLTSLDLSQSYAMRGSFSLGKWSRLTSFDSCPGEVSGDHHVVWAGSAGTFYNRISVSGYDGYLSMARSVSPDGKSITLTASTPALAGRDISCLNYSLWTRSRSTASNSTSQYDTICDCWYNSYTIDTLAPISFAGHELPPRPECSNQLDDDKDGKTDYPADPDCASESDTAEAPPPPGACADGRDNDNDRLIDLKDPGCNGKAGGPTETDRYPVKARFALKAKAHKCNIDTEVTVLPDIHPFKNFPFSRVLISVRGPGYSVLRRIRLGESDAYGFKVRTNGRYKVSGFYLGDRFRKKSSVRKRSVRVSNCR